MPGSGSVTLDASGNLSGSLGLQLPSGNTLTIDGIDNTDEFTGSSRTELSLEVVREFQVVKSGWLPESGGGAGIN